MSMKSLFLAGILTLAVASSSMAQGVPQQGPVDPGTRALGQMLQESISREAQALSRAYAAEAQLGVERKRADEAEGKLKQASPGK